MISVRYSGKNVYQLRLFDNDLGKIKKLLGVTYKTDSDILIDVIRRGIREITKDLSRKA